MSLLIKAVERYLGNFNEWPSDILDQLFFRYPPPTRKLLAFYGNGAPRSLVSQLFHACNKHSTALCTDIIYSTYEEWDRYPMAYRISRFYNLKIRQYIHLHGKQRWHLITPIPDMEDPPLGIINTDFPFLIERQIKRIQEANVFYL
jgi:myo-inositol catabolism protein IolC